MSRLLTCDFLTHDHLCHHLFYLLTCNQARDELFIVFTKKQELHEFYQDTPIVVRLKLNMINEILQQSLHTQEHEQIVFP